MAGYIPTPLPAGTPAIAATCLSCEGLVRQMLVKLVRECRRFVDRGIRKILNGWTGCGTTERHSCCSGADCCGFAGAPAAHVTAVDGFSMPRPRTAFCVIAGWYRREAGPFAART